MILEDLDFLFSGPDAVQVTVGAFAFKGLLDHSGQELAEGMFSTEGKVLTVKTSDVVGLRERASILIDGAEYRVRKAPQRFDDGLLSRILVGSDDD